MLNNFNILSKSKKEKKSGIKAIALIKLYDFANMARQAILTINHPCLKLTQKVTYSQ